MQPSTNTACRKNKTNHEEVRSQCVCRLERVLSSSGASNPPLTLQSLLCRHQERQLQSAKLSLLFLEFLLHRPWF